MPGLSARLHGHPEIVSIGLRGSYTALAFFISILLANLMSPSELGRYFEMIAWIMLIGVAVQAGWATFLVREVAALREQGRRSELLGMSRFSVRLVAAISIAASLAMIAAAAALGVPSSTMRLVWIAAPAIPLLATSTVRQAVTRGMGRPLLGQICESVTRPGIQLAGLLVWWSGLVCCVSGPEAALAIFLAAIALSALAAFLLERGATAAFRGTARPAVPSRSEWFSSLVQNALIGWSAAANQQIPVLILAVAKPPAEIAQFRIAQQLSLLMVLGLNSVIMVYAPDISRYFARKDMASAQVLASRGALVALATAVPLAVAYALFGRQILALLFGAEYSAAYMPLLALTAGQLGNAMFGLVLTMAVAARNEPMAVKAQIVGTFANVLLCILLVPSLGAVGAAVASAISLILWNAIVSRRLRRDLGIRSLASPRELLHLRARHGSQDRRI